MKKSAIILAAAATFLTSISIAAPASSASFNWGFDAPWFGFQADRSLSSRHFRGSDRVHIGPLSFNIGLSLGRSHVTRCETRYRSYDAWSDTFIGYDGREHRCRL